MLELNAETRLQLEEDILLQALPEVDHYFAFNVENGDNYKLNRTAHWVLTTIGNGVNYSEIRQNFSQKFEVDGRTAEQDLSEVLQYALENKIIKEVTP